MAKPFPNRCSQAPSVSAWLDASGRHLPLAERTVLELARRIQCWQGHPGGPDAAPELVKRRALRARDRLVRHNQRLIAHSWAHHRRSLPASDEGTADAFQEAALSLVRAAEKFDPKRGYRFSTYASFWVRRGFAVHERHAKRPIRLPHDKAAIVLKALRLAQLEEVRTGKLPAIEWLAERCGPRDSAVPVEQLQELLVIWWCTAVCDLDRPIGGSGSRGTGRGAPGTDGAGTTRMELVPGRPAVPIEAWDPLVQQADLPDGPASYFSCLADGDDEQRALLPQLLEQLDPTSRRLLWHRYLRERPLTGRQIKRVMGLELDEQAQLEEQALDQLRAAAKAWGAL
jgi:RNA polymerase primary sigma factor